jgi:hypothetical protein
VAVLNKPCAGAVGVPDDINKKLEAVGRPPHRRRRSWRRALILMWDNKRINHLQHSSCRDNCSYKRLDPTFIMPGFDLLGQEYSTSKKIQEFFPYT